MREPLITKRYNQSLWFRESTNEWIADLELRRGGFHSLNHCIRFAAKTKIKAIAERKKFKYQ